MGFFNKNFHILKQAPKSPVKGTAFPGLYTSSPSSSREIKVGSEGYVFFLIAEAENGWLNAPEMRTGISPPVTGENQREGQLRSSGVALPLFRGELKGGPKLDFEW